MSLPTCYVLQSTWLCNSERLSCEISGVQLISYSSIFEESSKTQIRSALGEILGRRLRPLVFLGVQVHCVKREITLESNKY